jgi:hypothetical protein
MAVRAADDHADVTIKSLQYKENPMSTTQHEPASKPARPAGRTAPPRRTGATVDKVTNSKAAAGRRERASASRRTAERDAARRRLRTRVIISAAVSAGVAGVVVLGVTTGRHPAVAAHALPLSAVDTAAAAAGSAGPPWGLPADPAAAIRKTGLSTAGTEGTAEHYHAHLDVIVNGKSITVPDGIGVDNAAQQISPLHTHDTTGAIHIETPTKGTPYYLGQVFTEWGVGLSQHMLGGLHADGTNNRLTAYVDGKQYTGNPADIRLAMHQEIALVFGPDAQHITAPSSWNFAAAGL